MWVCQPVLPPGCHTLFWTYRSNVDAFFRWDNQAFARRSSWRQSGIISLPDDVIPPNGPLTIVVAVYPVAGVASTIPGLRRIVTAIGTAKIKRVTPLISISFLARRPQSRCLKSHRLSVGTASAAPLSDFKRQSAEPQYFP
jgi:hypothetical protein